VMTELEEIKRKTPIDRKVFLYAFLGVFGFLLLIAFLLPLISAPSHTSPTAAAVHAQAPAEPAPVTSAQQKAIDENDGHSHDPLPPAPLKELEEPLGTNTIPAIATDGRKPAQIYARPYNKDDIRPRISLVVGELGLSRTLSEAAINDLPGPATLVFSNYSSEPDGWMAKARQSGHEVLLSIPMEPLEYPSSDPGPNALLTRNNNDENKALLLKHLINGKGYIGVTSFSGSRMNTAAEKLKPLLEELNKRGLIWLDTNFTPFSVGDSTAKQISLASTKANALIDDNMGIAAMDRILRDVEHDAVKIGRSVLLVQASPLAISHLREWAKGLAAKHISLAPLSAVIE